jgi:hypothetical protein
VQAGHAIRYMVLHANTKGDASTFEVSHLEHEEREGRDVIGVIDRRD